MIVVTMGVSGSGKSVVGAALADALRWPFLEGDSLHPAANVAKMAAGHPLDDADRAPWLAALARWMAAHADGVVSCSALKRSYRDILRGSGAEVRFVLLDVDAATLADRVGHREGHFMPGSLLPSQLATLERPGPDENALAVLNTGSIDAVVAGIVASLDLAGKQAG